MLLHELLHETGSIYVHIGPNVSHYVRVILDEIFGSENNLNEIIWRRTTPKGLAFSRFAANHDLILFYRKGEAFTWNAQYMPCSPEYLERYNLGMRIAAGGFKPPRS